MSSCSSHSLLRMELCRRRSLWSANAYKKSKCVGAESHHFLAGFSHDSSWPMHLARMAVNSSVSNTSFALQSQTNYLSGQTANPTFYLCRKAPNIGCNQSCCSHIDHCYSWDGLPPRDRHCT
jgi:hypothetical protein